MINPDDHHSGPSKHPITSTSAPESPLDKSKPKEIRFDKSLRKRAAENLSTSFKFDIMVQLANILTCITIHELLRLSNEARDALYKALVDSETFLTQVLPLTKEEYCCCHQISSLPSITFSLEDILVKNPNHDRPLYYTRYIRSTKVERILIDPSSALTIMPVCLM